MRGGWPGLPCSALGRLVWGFVQPVQTLSCVASGGAGWRLAGRPSSLTAGHRAIRCGEKALRPGLWGTRRTQRVWFGCAMDPGSLQYLVLCDQLGSPGSALLRLSTSPAAEGTAVSSDQQSMKQMDPLLAFWELMVQSSVWLTSCHLRAEGLAPPSRRARLTFSGCWRGFPLASWDGSRRRGSPALATSPHPVSPGCMRPHCGGCGSEGLSGSWVLCDPSLAPAQILVGYALSLLPAGESSPHVIFIAHPWLGKCCVAACPRGKKLNSGAALTFSWPHADSPGREAAVSVRAGPAKPVAPN